MPDRREIALNTVLGIMAFTGLSIAHDQGGKEEGIKQNVAAQTRLLETTDSGYISPGTSDNTRLDFARVRLAELQQKEIIERREHNNELKKVAIVIGTVGTMGILAQTGRYISKKLKAMVDNLT